MGAAIGLVAFLVTLVAFIAAAGHTGYLAMISTAAKKRAGGEPAVAFARKRLPAAGVTVGVALLAMLISTGGVGADVLAILLGAGTGLTSVRALRTSQARFRGGDY
jgi:hypothetical protein